MTPEIDAGSLLGDFKSEAEAHIEKIESAFLDADSLAGDPELMDGVFRAAHSLKGTASFFSLDKIVAVAHALESVFSKIKNGEMEIGDEIADAALQSVDCLKELLDNLNDPDAVDTDGLLKLLKNYSDPQTAQNASAAGEGAGEFKIPFDLKSGGMEDILKGAAKRGHTAYYLKIIFDSHLGRYYSNPKGLIDDITSIGGILDAKIDGKAAAARSPSNLAAMIANKREAHSFFTFELIVTSVLEPELFLVAVELDGNCVHPIPKETILSDKSGKETGPQSEKPAAKATVPLARQLAQKSDFLVRLDVSVINGLMDLTNEMILARNQLLSSTAAHRKSISGLTPILNDVSRLTSEIQEKVMRTRMQPVSVVFGKFPRIIRDTARSLGKDIQINILGGGVTLDKYLLDALSDPITQLVKNSADHGIERPERRAALGKPQKGTITLDAYMRNGLAVIEVSDDGAGIDTDALKRKSMEKGIASEEQLSGMTKNALLNLIFAPGLSTAKQVTNVSGRGVGMDIVKTNIEKLGGSIDIESELRKGTTIRLKTPLTLSVVRALIVTINSVQYAVPELNVERIVRVPAAALPARGGPCGSPALELNGRLIPAVTLEEVDAKANGSPPLPAENVTARAGGREGVVKYLLLKAGDKNFALLIDDALDTEETLVNTLPVYMRGCRAYSGTTVLGSGDAAMILDAEGIMRFMEIEGADRTYGEPEKTDEADKEQVIIFQCSDAEYLALPADKVSRIERVAPEDIREEGGGRFINIAGKTVRVISAERAKNCAPVQNRAGQNKLYLLMLAAKPPPGAAGLLAGRVLDKTGAAFKHDGSAPDGGSILGTGVYNEKALILLNPDEIMRTAGTGTVD